MGVSEPEGVGFLLIADLDIGHPDSKFTWPEYRDELERDLRREHEQTGPWDVIAIVGSVWHDESEAALPPELEDLVRTVRALGSTPVVVRADDAPQATMVSRDGTSVAVVCVDAARPGEVAPQLASLAAGTAGWSQANVRLLLSDLPHPDAFEGVERRMFDLHATPRGRTDRKTARYHVGVRSLLGVERQSQRFGYISGRLREFGIEFRPRAMADDGSAKFGIDLGFGTVRRGFVAYALAGALRDEAASFESARVNDKAAADSSSVPAPPSLATTGLDTVASIFRSSAEDGFYRLESWAADGSEIRLMGLVPELGTQTIAVPSGQTEVRPTLEIDLHPRSVTTARGNLQAEDSALWLADPESNRTLLLKGVFVESVTWLDDRREIAAVVGNEVLLLSETGTHLRTVALHDDPCMGITATSDARLVATISVLGEVKLWRTADWAELATWQWSGSSAMRDCIAFSPAAWTLALCEGNAVEFVDVDPAILELEVEVEETAVTAKVVLVGQGRVGKTCLAQRMVDNVYTDQDSTHGMRFWSLPLPADGPLQREIMFWDLGGQAEYRLLHPLFLRDTQLALLCLDPATQYYDDALHWSECFDAIEADTPRIIVGTKVDSADAPVDRPALERVAAQCNALDTILTSARNGLGHEDLIERVTATIPWDTIAKDTRGQAASWLHEHTEVLRRKGKVVVSFDDLATELPDDIDAGDLGTAIGQLARRGTIANTRNAMGQQLVVLRIEEIERYACSIIVAAQNRADGVPAVDLWSLRDPQTVFPRIATDARLPRNEEVVILDCVLDMFVRHGIALPHHGQLVFPTLFETGGDEADPPKTTTYFEFGGVVDNAYASLVTDLALANAYGRPRMSRGTARFTRSGIGTCGVRRRDASPGRGPGLDVFFEDGTDDSTEYAFISYVEQHLSDAGIELVEHNHVACHSQGCGHVFDPAVVRRRTERGQTDVVCPVCEARSRIVLSTDQARRHDTELHKRTRKERTDARDGRGRGAAVSKRIVEGAEDSGRPGWILVLSDLHIAADTDIQKLRQTLLEDLRRGNGLKPDAFAALVVCGDITNFASAAEFEHAERFLAALVSDLKTTPANTIIVPGNHDLTWDPPPFVPLVGTRPATASQYEYVQEGRITLRRDEAAYRACFENFSRSLYHPFYSRSYPADPARQFQVLDLPQTGLTFVTFNSAWNTSMYHPDAATIVDNAVGNAIEALDKIEGDRLKIAVWHHPITGDEKIVDDAFIERLRGAGVRLCLHGHVHQSRTDLLGHMHANKMWAVGTGTFGAPAKDRPESKPRLYQLIELSDDRRGARIHTRQRELGGAPWKPFHEWPNPDGSENLLPYFDVTFVA